jgi:hypothetical protein
VDGEQEPMVAATILVAVGLLADPADGQVRMLLEAAGPHRGLAPMGRRSPWRSRLDAAAAQSAGRVPAGEHHERHLKLQAH